MLPDLTRDDVYRIETARLWLRWPRAADARTIQKLAGEKAVASMTAHIPWPYPDGAAEAAIFKARAGNAAGECLRVMMTRKNAPNEVIGMIGLSPTCDGRPKLGYWVGSPFWGKGLATEAAQAMIDAGFTFANFAEIEAGVFIGNIASRKVLEKSGFQYAGMALCNAPARGGSMHADRFVLTRKTWASLKSWRAPVVEGLQLDRAAAAIALEASG